MDSIIVAGPQCNTPVSEASAFCGQDVDGITTCHDQRGGPYIAWGGDFKGTVYPLSNAVGSFCTYNGATTVQETDAGGGSDSCYDLGDEITYGTDFAPLTQIPKYHGKWSFWSVNPDNTYWADTLGLSAEKVSKYRSLGRVPCTITLHQQMEMQATDGSWIPYGLPNTLKITVTASQIGVARGGSTYYFIY